MDKHAVITSASPEIVLEEIGGALQYKAWERDEVSARASSNDLILEEQDDVVRIRCSGNCQVYAPVGAMVRAEMLHGDARFKLLEDQLSIGEVHGSLSLRNVAEVEIEQVHGDLNARQVAGDLRARQIQGNAVLRDVQSSLEIEQVQGNADLRNVESDIEIAAQGNLRIRLSLLAGIRYDLEAAGNFHGRIPEDAGLEVSLTSHGHSIRVDLPEQQQRVQDENLEFTVGDGRAAFNVTCGGILYLGSHGRMAEDWEAGLSEDLDSITDEFDQQFTEQIESQIESQMEFFNQQINEQLSNLSSRLSASGMSTEEQARIIERARQSSERSAQRAQERMRRNQEKLARKLEAARRRNEQHAKAARARGQQARRSWQFEWGEPAEDRQGANEDERLMVLRMLEQKKISLEEAQQLLDALENS